MNSHWISIGMLGSMFVPTTALSISMGMIAFVDAFLVGVLVAGLNAKAIMAGFPADLFLTLVGITYLFALGQTNGTVDWLVRMDVKAVRGRIVAIPWNRFFILAGLSAVGAVSPTAGAVIALGFAARYGINPLTMGLFVIHGTQGGGFSPISIYGGITNKVVTSADLPLNPIATKTASMVVCLGVAILLFVLMGGRTLIRRQVDISTGGFGVQHVAHSQGGARVYGDAEGESMQQGLDSAKVGPSLLDADYGDHTGSGQRWHQG